MTFLYDAGYSVVLLRPKNEVKPLTQSAEKWICMGKWALEILAELFLKNKKTSDDRTFFIQCVSYHSPGLKSFIEKVLRGAKKQFMNCNQNFTFSQK